MHSSAPESYILPEKSEPPETSQYSVQPVLSLVSTSHLHQNGGKRIGKLIGASFLDGVG